MESMIGDCHSFDFKQTLELIICSAEPRLEPYYNHCYKTGRKFPQKTM